MNMKTANKFHAVKTGRSASKKEEKRLIKLKELESLGKITDLQTQVKYMLIPSQWETVVVNGKPKRKCVEQCCSYIADFVYKENGQLVVEDVKGYRRGAAYSLYAIKRKLMLQVYGIRVKET